MKKILYMLVAALGLVSCSQDEAMEGVAPGNSSVFASLPDDSGSRVSIEVKKLKWEAGDRFVAFQSYEKQGLNKVTEGIPFEVNSAYVNSDDAMFDAVEDQQADYAVAYGVYPASLDVKCNGDGTVKEKVVNWDTMEKAKVDNNDATYSITLPEGDQNPGVDSPMFGIAKNGKITFQLVTGMLKIDLNQTQLDPSKVENIKLITTDKALSGNTVIKNVGKYSTRFEAAAISKAGQNEMVIPARCAINNVYYVPVPAGTYPNIEIVITDGTNTEHPKFENKEIGIGWMYKVFKEKE